MSLSRVTTCRLMLLPESHCVSVKWYFKRMRSTTYYPEDEYTDKPNYPTILDLSPKSTYKRSRDEKLDKIKRVGTVEEKLIGINMPRFYGWNSLILKEGNYPFNILPFIQHITRTDFIELKKLPFFSTLSKAEIDAVVQNISPKLKEAIILEVAKKRHRHVVDKRIELMGEKEQSDEVTKGVVKQINRILTVNLAQHAPHIYETEFDIEPRLEAFWRVGGFYPGNETYNERKKDKEDNEKKLKRNPHAKRKIEEEPEDLVGHFIQYLGTPVLQLRHSKPLRPLEPEDSAPRPDLSCVPVMRYHFGYHGLEKTRRHGTNIPGFWPGAVNEFGLLSYHTQGHLLGRPPSFGKHDVRDTLTSQAILAGYSWLLAQATYQGFSTFQDITYPLSTTTVITDGRVFSFFASQLNTLLLHDEFIDENPKLNVCYGLPTVDLYKEIDGNELVGWNDEVVALLVEAYLNAPAERKGLELRPYLDKEAPLVQHLTHGERRDWLHKLHRYLMSNRPRNRLEPEIYDWEMIYKIKFQTRPQEPKRRFFELGIDPFNRRLDDHAKVYIPRKFRDPNNYKKKFKDTFYPDC